MLLCLFTTNSPYIPQTHLYHKISQTVIIESIFKPYMINNEHVSTQSYYLDISTVAFHLGFQILILRIRITQIFNTNGR